MQYATLAALPPLPTWIWQAASYEKELGRGVFITLLGILLATAIYSALCVDFYRTDRCYSYKDRLIVLIVNGLTYSLAAYAIYEHRACAFVVCPSSAKVFGIPGWLNLAMTTTFAVYLVLDLWDWSRAESGIEVAEVEVLEAGTAKKSYGPMLRAENGMKIQRHHSAPGAV